MPPLKRASARKGTAPTRVGIVATIAVVIAIIALANRHSGQPSAPRGSRPAASSPSGPIPAGAGHPALAGTGGTQPAATAPAPVSAATQGAGGSRAGLPGQWALAAFQAPALWRTTKGQGVVVAVVDTGVDTANPDLAKAVVNPAHAPVDKSPNSHGTAIAGLIAGRGAGPDPGQRIVGLAPGASILDIRVTSDPATVTAGQIVTGINDAIKARAKVINVSLGVSTDDPRLQDAIIRALKSGALVVASAGATSTLSYPANSTGGLAVAAIDSHGDPPVTDLTPYLANAVYAPGVDLSAPAKVNGNGGGKGGYLPDISGNDYATAYVSAAAALLFAAHPGVRAEEVRSLLVSTAKGAQPNAQAGFLDPRAALTGVLHLPPGPAAPTAAPPTAAPPGAVSRPAGATAPARKPAGIAGGNPSPPGVLTPVTVAMIIGGLAVVALITVGAARRRPASRRRADLTTTTWDGW